MKKPVIGILANVLIDDRGLFPGMERSVISYEYIGAVVRAGGIPLVLPIVEGEKEISQQIALIDGLLLSGGYDLDPLEYGEEPSPQLEPVYPRLDKYQLQAVRIAANTQKAILGVCRGMQVINVAFGGTLYQDIAQAKSTYFKHFQQGPRHLASHSVELEAESSLAKIFGRTAILTNSFHHQAVKDLAQGFAVTAKSKDGIIEGIEKMDQSFILGVQWHPEMMAEHSVEMSKIFAAFVGAAK